MQPEICVEVKVLFLSIYFTAKYHQTAVNIFVKNYDKL